jgi:hypothetical protein
MLPSSDALAENVKRVVHNLAAEARRRLQQTLALDEAAFNCIEVEVEQVLLDWFLGDFIPQGMLAPTDVQEKKAEHEDH